MQGTIMAINPDHVLGTCAWMKAEGYRFVTMTCNSLGPDALEVLYHFDRNLELAHLRVGIAGDAHLPSISGVFRAAFLVENEIQDLFGLHFAGLALDYHRTLYLEAEVVRAPFCQYTVEEKEGEAAEKRSRPGKA
jgi:ech hydrogenase subunit D